VAEVQAFIEGRSGGQLRLRDEPLHRPSSTPLIGPTETAACQVSQ
jgi:hypothetical protein